MFNTLISIHNITAISSSSFLKFRRFFASKNGVCIWYSFLRLESALARLRYCGDPEIRITMKQTQKPDIRYPAFGIAGYPAKSVSGASLVQTHKIGRDNLTHPDPQPEEDASRLEHSHRGIIFKVAVFLSPDKNVAEIFKSQRRTKKSQIN